MYIGNIKIYNKIKKELETIIQTFRIFSQDVGIKFRIEKYVMLTRKKGKRETKEVIKLTKHVHEYKTSSEYRTHYNING